MIDVLPFKLKHIVLAFLLPLFVYMSLYTWNWRTGHLDRLAQYAGLEIVGTVLVPGKWVHARVDAFWSAYIHLVDVHQKNIALKQEIKELKLQCMRLREKAKTASRLRELMHFSPPPNWQTQGADIIANRVGPNAVLKTLLINKGTRDGITSNTPVLTPDGLVGRVNQASPHFATVLLITDPNSNIPVRGQRSRTNGILCGQGGDNPLRIKHVPQNAPLFQDELMVTSGLAGLFPEGLPVARVDEVSISDLSLFKTVQALPLVALPRLEEVLVLQRNQTAPVATSSVLH